MWFLPTRGRPEECRQLIEAMYAADDVPAVAVMIDDDRRRYADVPWPAHWEIHAAREHLEMTRALNTLLALYPGEPVYGFFGDHFRPLTKWSKPLEAAAGDWLMAWPCDGISSDRQPAGAPTFGGKLIAALGWLCLPTTIHVCTDRVWWFLWKHLGIAKHVEAARFARTWPLGQGQVARLYQGRDINGHDFAAWQDWQAREGAAVLAKIRAAMIADGYAFTPAGLHPRHGASPFKPGW